MTFNITNCKSCIRWNIWRMLNDLQCKIFQRTDDSHEFFISRIRRLLRKWNDLTSDVWFCLNTFIEFKTSLTLNDDRCISIRHTQHFDHLRYGSELIEVRISWIFNCLITLCNNTDDLVTFVSIFDQVD